MKRVILKDILIIISAITLFVGCDKIDEPFREQSSNTNNNNNSGGTVDTSGPTVFNRTKNILVEDYTGHKCGNCPEAGTAATDLNALFGDKVVLVSIHAGFFATPNATGKYSYNFTTPEGDDLDNFFGISNAGNPNGMVNRNGKPTDTHIIPYPTWDDSVTAMMTKPADVLLNLQNSYNSSNRSVSTTINSKFISNLSGDYKLSVYLTEDSVVNWQKDYSKSPQDIPDYKHRHVFRDSFNNSAWGETVFSGTVTDTSTIYTKNYSLTLGSDWVASKCHVVAFIYNSTTYEVVQVEERKIIE